MGVGSEVQILVLGFLKLSLCEAIIIFRPIKLSLSKTLYNTLLWLLCFLMGENEFSD